MTTEFLLTSLIVVLIPGTGVIYTVSTGLFRGGRAAIAAAVGCTFGIVPHLLASIMGLAALLHMSALAFQTVKFAGVAYLLWLAWSMWRETGAIRFDSARSEDSLRRIAVRGILLNILNPKLSIFFLAFLPQFIPAADPAPLWRLTALATVFMAMTLVVFCAYGLCAHGVRRYIADSPTLLRRLQRGFALLFAALGAKLATTQQ